MKAMKQILNYNIHDILKFQIVLDQKFNFIDYLNIEHRFFEVENVDKPDIILNIGKFEPSNEDCYVVDSKYYIKDNYFYCKDSVDKTKWEVEIFGFESGDTKINFNIKVPGIRSLIPILGAHNLLLSPLIDYKLLKNGYFLIHSAGISKNNRAVLFAGRGGSFKSTFAMDFVRNAKFDLLGDERVILHKDGILAYPWYLRGFEYKCKNLKTENYDNFLDRFKLIKYVWSNYNLPQNLNINIANSSALKCLFITYRKNINKTNCKENSNLEKIINTLIINNKMEMQSITLPNIRGIHSNPYFEYMLAYSFIFPDSKVATHWDDLKRNLKETLENIPVYDLEIPIEYSDSVFSDVYDYVTSVVQ